MTFSDAKIMDLAHVAQDAYLEHKTIHDLPFPRWCAAIRAVLTEMSNDILTPEAAAVLDEIGAQWGAVRMIDEKSMLQNCRIKRETLRAYLATIEPRPMVMPELWLVYRGTSLNMVCTTEGGAKLEADALARNTPHFPVYIRHIPAETRDIK